MIVPKMHSRAVTAFSMCQGEAAVVSFSTPRPPRHDTMGPMLFSPNKDETERLLDYETTRRGEDKPWHPAARFATGALVTVFVVRARMRISPR